MDNHDWRMPGGERPNRRARRAAKSKRKSHFYTSNRPKLSLESGLILGAGLFSGASFGLATTELIPERDLIGCAKIVTITLSGIVAAMGANWLAVKHGAPQSATGFWLSKTTSVLSILAIGTGLSIGTQAGLTLRGTEELRLEQHGTALDQVIGHRNGMAVDANRVGGLLRDISSDLARHVSCEQTRGCLSGRSAGRGTITIALEELQAGSSNMETERRAGDGTRRAHLGDLNRLMIDYRRTLSDRTRSIWERRADLQAIDAKVDQKLSELDASQPVGLWRGFAEKLKSGVEIPNRPEVTQRINAILRKHGDALSPAVERIVRSTRVRPTFPSRTSVSDTLAYVAYFIPIAIVIAVIELVLPISIWTYTFVGQFWDRYRDEDRGDDPPPSVDPDDPSRTSGGSAATVGRGDEGEDENEVSPAAHRLPNLDAAPIDGPLGWSGRSRFNDGVLEARSNGGEND